MHEHSIHADVHSCAMQADVVPVHASARTPGNSLHEHAVNTHAMQS
jgi:hypothetical protein